MFERLLRGFNRFDLHFILNPFEYIVSLKRSRRVQPDAQDCNLIGLQHDEPDSPARTPDRAVERAGLAT